MTEPRRRGRLRPHATSLQGPEIVHAGERCVPGLFIGAPSRGMTLVTACGYEGVGHARFPHPVRRNVGQFGSEPVVLVIGVDGEPPKPHPSIRRGEGSLPRTRRSRLPPRRPRSLLSRRPGRSLHLSAGWCASRGGSAGRRSHRPSPDASSRTPEPRLGAIARLWLTGRLARRLGWSASRPRSLAAVGSRPQCGQQTWRWIGYTPGCSTVDGQHSAKRSEASTCSGRPSRVVRTWVGRSRYRRAAAMSGPPFRGRRGPSPQRGGGNTTESAGC